MSNDLDKNKQSTNSSRDSITSIDSCLLSLPPTQFALISTIFGLILQNDLNVDQKNALGNFIVSIGQTLLTAAAQEQSLQSDNSQNDIEDLKIQVALLKKELSKHSNS